MNKNILLLDDDQLVLNHIYRLADWERLGYNQPVLCTSIRQAKQAIDRQEPDVCILDIEIPGGNGLEFAGELRQDHRNIIVLMLTAFREFRYAQQAVSVGAFDYLIKSELTAERFTERLKQIREMLDNREHNRQLMRETMLCMLLSSETPQKQRSESGSILATANRALVLMRVHCPRGLKCSLPIPEADADEVIRYANAKDWVCLRMEDSIWVLLENEDLNCLHVTARIAGEELRSRLQTAELTLSDPFIGTDKLGEIHQRFLWMDEERFFRNVSACSYTLPHSIKKPVYVDVNFKPLWEAILRSDRSLFTKELHQVISILPEVKDRNRYLSELCEQMQEKLAIAPQSFNAQCLQEVESWCLSRFDAALQQAEGLRGTSKLTQEIAAMIWSNPSITQTELAEQLHHSVGYLRAVFRQDMRMTIGNYLMEYRIKQAKKMLSIQGVKIHDVAETLGYQSSQYFSVVFRKATGLTPSEYLRGENK